MTLSRVNLVFSSGLQVNHHNISYQAFRRLVERLEETLKSVWSYLKGQNLEMGEDDTLEAEIIEESCRWLASEE